MRAKAFTFLTIFLISLMSFACGGTANTNTTANTNSTNPLETNKPAKEETTNNAPTLTPVYKAYCDARVKKDEAALRKVYSQDTIKFFESEMKEQKVKSLVAYHDDQISGKICEIRNEVITGDKAVAEITSDSYPNGIKIVFLKENGEWKMTNQSPVTDKKTDSVPASPANAPVANKK